MVDNISLVSIIIKKIVLPKDPRMYMVYAAIAGIFLAIFDKWLTALAIMFIVISIAVVPKTLRILAHPYASSNQKAGWAIGSLFCLFLLIAFYC